MADNRPRTILAIEIVSALLFFCDLMLAEFDWWLGTAVEIVVAGILLVLALLVTRRRDNMARLALTIFLIPAVSFALCLAVFDDLALAEFTSIELATFAAALGLSVAQVALLWSAPTSRWIARSYRDRWGSVAEQP